MKKINLNRKSKVRLGQYFSIALFVSVGWAWSLHWLAGIVVFSYANYLNAITYKEFKIFLEEKWIKKKD